MTKEQEKLVNEAIHKALKVLNCLNNDRVYETAWVKGAIQACKEALKQPLTRDWKETIDERIAKDDEFKRALEQPAQEIVRKVFDIDNFHSSVLDRIKFTSPQQWQGLSDDEICDLWTLSDKDIDGIDLGYTTQQHYFAALVEQASRNKNGFSELKEGLDD